MAEGKANFAFKTGDEGEEIDMTPLNQTSIDNLAATVERLAANPNLQNLASRDVSTREAIKSLRSLFNDQRFQKSYQFAQKVRVVCNWKPPLVKGFVSLGLIGSLEPIKLPYNACILRS